MSRISTRTKIAVGIGLLVLALVALTRRGPSSHAPQVSIRLLSSWTNNRIALSITNSGPNAVGCSSWITYGLEDERLRHFPANGNDWTVAPRSGLEVILEITEKKDEPMRFCLYCEPVQGPMHRLMTRFLSTAGAQTPPKELYFVHHDLPPKP